MDTSGVAPDFESKSRCDTGSMSSSASRSGVVVSGREAEVFDLVGDHLTHAEIGERLFISTRTVESHVASLRRKLGMIDHRSLVRMAVKFRSLPPVSAVPHEVSSFLGRSVELDEVAIAVASSRVVSVVGPGGIGKTRLAMRAAKDLSEAKAIDPVWVDLATVVAPGQIPQALVAALGVHEPGHRTYEQVAIDLLRQRTALVVLDNCEHVLDEVAAMVERILAACATVTVLLTSRVRLAVPHEQVVQLGGLPVGSTDTPGAAVDLFMERAEAGGATIADGERPRVADVCQALDGMPLAIELAAARVASLGLDGVESGLDDHRRLLVGGTRTQTRHRSVSDTVEWSYRLLTGSDQNVLSRVSTFRTAFSPADAGMVAAYAGISERDIAGALGRLAQHSLLEAATMPRVRYRTLETVRQFGNEQLSAKGDRTAQERHLDWCAGRVADLDGNEDESSWAAEVDAIADEVRATLASIGNTREVPAAHDLARQLADLLFDRGRTTDSQNMFEYAASLADSETIEAADLTLAAAVAKCRIAGPDALRLEQLATDKALAGGDIDLAVRSLASSIGLIARFQGMFDDPPPLDRANRLLEHASKYGAYSPIAEFTIAATEATLDPSRDIDELEDFASRALASGELVQASVLLEAVAVRYGEDQHPAQALDACRRRLGLFDSVTTGPSLAFELRDAFHTATFIATAAGHLEEAIELAERFARLPFLRDEPDLALEEGIVPNALAGNWNDTIKAGHAFLAGWEQAGRPVAPGRGIAPAALAMVHGLRSDTDQRSAWLETLRQIRGSNLTDQATGYGEVFDAIVELHHHRNEVATLRLAGDRPVSLMGGWYWQWHAALAAEAAVLAGHSNADEKIADATAATEHNPIASVLTRRARTLQDGTTEGLENVAAEFDNLGCPYQAARTLSLAGGATAERGAARLKSLGATDT